MQTPVSRDRGITLIEVVVAIAVLSIGVIASFRALNQSAFLVDGQTPRALAHLVAQNRAEELKLLGAVAGRSLPTEVTMGPIDWSVAQKETATQVGLIEVEITVRAADWPGARLIAYVPSEVAP